MTKFIGDNTPSSAWEAFYNRVLYRNDAITNVENLQQVKDFSLAEYVYYGRVDTKLNTVYPKENKMKVILNEESAESSFRLLDFASDAFEAVRTSMIAAKTGGIIPNDDEIFSRFRIRRAYESPIGLYNQYIDDLMDRFIYDYLDGQGVRKKVLNFNQFVFQLIFFMKNSPDVIPFTFTSWQRSTTSNIFTSGIAVDIGGLEFGEDLQIENNILNSPCFPHYLKVCKGNGFQVSRLAPTLMVADILSPGLTRYAEKNSITSTEDVFLQKYNFAFLIDYELLQNKLIDGYNLFVANFPFEKMFKLICPKTSSTEIIDRFPTALADLQRTYSMKRWLKIYIDIRNIEERGSLDKSEYEHLLRYIKMRKNIDNFQSMRYINNTFRNTYKSKHGGYNYYERLIKARKKDDDIASIQATSQSTESALEEGTDFSMLSESSTPETSGGSSGGY